MKKKHICSAMALCMLLCGCGNNNNTGGATSEATTAAPGTTQAPETTSAPETTTTAATEAARTTNYGEMRDITIKELVGEMKCGWNLGNTLDAEGGETAWGNPKTTHEMIDFVANAGINVIRLPTTWGDKIDVDNGYKVSDEWMQRVREIVDYAFDNDMYVILNTHHETSWIKPAEDTVNDCLPEFTALWKQIAEEFEPYGDHLLFEGLNEPRIVGGKNEWNGGTAEGREAINVLNNAFIETVRATGGNNAKRALVVTTYAASITKKSLSELRLPEDDKRLVLSQHAYTPYAFTYNVKEDWEIFEFDEETCTDEINRLMKYCEDFTTERGVPVIITEFGAVSKSKPGETERNDAESEKWVEYYVGRAKQAGIPCVVWDNGYYKSGNELFGLLNRTALEWYRPGFIEAFVKASN